MKLDLSQREGKNFCTGYGEGFVLVNGQRFERSLIVLPERLIADWGLDSFESLSARDFDFLLSLQPEILLLGTGDRLRFPHPRLSASLVQANVGMEVMDTRAACRTYNVLVEEGRKVAAALLLER
ncbi:MAG: Mth938-like domain-containing protein [Burkholderiales bacterium]|nr:Mth938-like domain-containing protein [Burkholderiales bacterium]